MSERRMAPHVARAMSVAQAKKLPAAPPSPAPSPFRPAVAPHVAAALGRQNAPPAAQAKTSPINRPAAPHVAAAIAAPARRERPVAHFLSGAPLQAKLAPGPPPAPPRPFFALPRVVQRMEEQDDEFVLDDDEKEEAELEEVRHEKLLDIKENKKKWARVGKPKGLVNDFFEGYSFTPSSPVREQDVYDQRDNPNKVFPKGKQAEATFKINCNRCGKPIRLSSKYHELGVGFDKKQRKRPPLGHILDFAIYRFALEFHIEQNVPEKYQVEYRKIATWDKANLGLEHFDCNSRAKKVTQKNITSDQEDKGSRLIVKCHDRWLKQAKENVDG